MALATKVSGLALTATINIAIEVVFLALYSIFRKHASNANIYFAGQIQREKSSKFSVRSFAINNYLPSSTWIKKAWKLSEDEIMQNMGLDSLVFIRIYIFCLRFFGICTILGLFVLVPVNYLCGQIVDIDIITSDTLDKFTTSNVTDGSEKLWVHFSFLYCFSFLAYVLLYLEYRYVANLRVDYLYSSQPEPSQFTVLVRAIPNPSQQTYGQQVDEFFSTYYPGTYLLQNSVYADSKWQKLLREVQWVSREVEFLRQVPEGERAPRQTGFLGIGKKEDPLNYYSRRLGKLQKRFKEWQAKFQQTSEEIPVSFVSFKTRWGATVAAQTWQTPKPLQWVTEWAPEPGDVNWRSLSIHFSLLWIIRIGIGILFVCITILYFIPAGLVYTLATLDKLKTWFPFATQILSIPVVGTLVNGYLPSLLLATLYLFIPPLMLFLTEFEGYPSISSQEIQTCGKVFLFLVTNSFFLVTYGSVIELFNQVIESPRQIPNLLATAVSSQANFFMNFVMTKGWTGLTVEILQPYLLLTGFLWRRVLRKRLYGPYADSLPYFKALPNLLLFIFIGFIYVLIAPLMLPFLMIYFFVGYIVFRNQILNRYEPAYETGGRYWPHVHDRVIFSLFMMQVIGIGLFGVKVKPILSTLSIPLLPVTLVFNHYCHLRFYPVFQDTSIQISVSKDKEEEQNGLREDIHRNLEKAYLCPALQPLEVDVSSQSGSGDSGYEPLLSPQEDNEA
eukprot:c22003_g4_i1 orf=389-2575(-)